jgi:tetratricopeptide (TPR) repeat protein
LVIQKIGAKAKFSVLGPVNLAMDYYEAGRPDDAIRLLRDALPRQEANLGPEHPRTLRTQFNLALVHRDSGRVDDAVGLLREALGIAQRKHGTESALAQQILNDLAVAHLAAGHPGEAVAILEELLKLRKDKLGPDHPVALTTANNLVRAYLDARRWTEAAAIARPCLEARLRKQPDDWLRYHTMSQLGAALAGAAKYAEAEPLLIAGYEGLKAREARIPVPSRKLLAAAAARIVPFYEAWGRPDQTARWRQRLGQPDPRASKP